VIDNRYDAGIREANMNLIRINERTLLNPDAIAWIDFESDEHDSGRAVVHFLLSDQTGGLVKQVFTGSDARILQDFALPRHHTEEREERAAAKVSFRPARKKKAWFFSGGEDRPVFLAFINAKGSCSLRSYDYETGIFVGKQYHPGDYQEAFPELLEKSRELAMESQPNLERDCKVRLPDRVLAYLKNQVAQEDDHV